MATFAGKKFSKVSLLLNLPHEIIIELGDILKSKMLLVRIPPGSQQLSIEDSCLQHTATHCNTLQHAVLQCVDCITLQHTVLQCDNCNALQHKVLQCVAVCCRDVTVENIYRIKAARYGLACLLTPSCIHD